MNKQELLQKMCENGVVAVIRADSIEQALEASKACARGGIGALEITYTVKGADKVIEALASDESVNSIIGAGTVLDAITARESILKGAKFIVSPSFDMEVCDVCNLYKVPYFSGCLTPTEVVNALRHGVDIVKIFPGSLVGPSYLKAIHGPLPHAQLMPSGGVELDNIKDWIKNGAVAVSAGSSLLKGMKEGDYQQIEERAKAFVEEVKKARLSI